MRIVVMGTGPFAVPTCQQLLQDGHDIALVVTRPLVDPAAKKPPPRPVFQWAQQSSLDIFEPASMNAPEAIAHVAERSPELLFVCDYGQILSKDCLRVARLGGINLHGSILPRHRGAAPVQWALLRGDTTAGVTVIHMTPRLDAGPALSVATTTIAADETAGELEPRLAELGVAATQQAIAMLADWDEQSPIGSLQDQSQVTKAPRFAKSDGQLDLRLPAEYLVRLVRACQPWPGTFAELQWASGKQMRIMVRAARHMPSLEQLQHAAPGTAIALDSQTLGQTWEAPWSRVIAVATPTGVLLIGRLQPAGKREMDAAEFLRGHPLDEAAQFQLPPVLQPQLA